MNVTVLDRVVNKRRVTMITFVTPNGIPLPYDPGRSVVGYLPSFFSRDDPRPAKEQINDKYPGGWSPFPSGRYEKRGFILRDDKLFYPGDPPIRLIAKATLNHEELLLFEHSWLAIVQEDGSYEVARVD